MNDFLRSAVKAYRHVRPAELRVVLLQSAERILPEMPERLAAFAHRILERRGVEIRLLTRLKCATAEAAIVQSKQTTEPELLPTRTIVATVPVTSHPILPATLDVELRGGKLPVTPELELVGHAGVWAFGDCASIPLKEGTFAPPTAQHALRQADVCARNILANYRGVQAAKFCLWRPRQTGLARAAVGCGRSVRRLAFRPAGLVAMEGRLFIKISRLGTQGAFSPIGCCIRSCRARHYAGADLRRRSRRAANTSKPARRCSIIRILATKSISSCRLSPSSRAIISACWK